MLLAPRIARARPHSPALLYGACLIAIGLYAVASAAGLYHEPRVGLTMTCPAPAGDPVLTGSGVALALAGAAAILTALRRRRLTETPR